MKYDLRRLLTRGDDYPRVMSIWKAAWIRGRSAITDSRAIEFKSSIRPPEPQAPRWSLAKSCSGLVVVIEDFRNRPCNRLPLRGEYALCEAIGARTLDPR